MKGTSAISTGCAPTTAKTSLGHHHHLLTTGKSVMTVPTLDIHFESGEDYRSVVPQSKRRPRTAKVLNGTTISRVEFHQQQRGRPQSLRADSAESVRNTFHTTLPSSQLAIVNKRIIEKGTPLSWKPQHNPPCEHKLQLNSKPLPSRRLKSFNEFTLAHERPTEQDTMLQDDLQAHRQYTSKANSCCESQKVRIHKRASLVMYNGHGQNNVQRSIPKVKARPPPSSSKVTQTKQQETKGLLTAQMYQQDLMDRAKPCLIKFNRQLRMESLSHQPQGFHFMLHKILQEKSNDRQKVADILFSTRKFGMKMAKRTHNKDQSSIDCADIKKLAIVGSLSGKQVNLQGLNDKISEAETMQKVYDILQFGTQCDLAKTYQQLVANI